MNFKTKNVRRAAMLILTLSMIFSLAGCGEAAPTGLWADATYTADTELGEGAKTIEVEVSAEETAVTFTIHTDAEILGDALLEHELVAGEESEFGLYVTAVNGMTADYDADGMYWSLLKDGDYSMTGVDATEIADGEHYELVCTKG